MGFLQKLQKQKNSKKDEDDKKQRNCIDFLTQERRTVGQQLLTKCLENDYALEIATQDQKLYCMLTILEKRAEDRMAKEIKILARLTESIKFFKEVRLSENGSSIHEQLCKHLIPRSFEANKTLFNQGDHGEEFWIILTGEVKVLKREFVEIQPGDSLANQEDDENKSDHQLEQKKQTIPTKITVESQQNQPIQGEFQMVEKVRLGPGNCFGELALVSNGENRKATVQTTKDSEFAVIMKDDFLRIVKVINQNSVFIERFASMPLFSQLNYNQVKQLYDICYEREFRHNNIVYSEGDNPEEIYFVKNGEFVQKIAKKDEYKYEICNQTSDLLGVLSQQILPQNGKKIEPPQKSTNPKRKEELNMLLTSNSEQSKAYNSMKNKEKLLQLEQQNLEKASEQHLQTSEDTILGELMMHKNQKSKIKKLNPLLDHMKSDQFITLKIMGRGECFGEEEVLIRKNREYKRVSTLVCSSDSGSLYCFNKKDFLRKFYNDEVLQKIFKSQLSIKCEQRALQIQRFADTHNSHAKIFDIQSNLVRVVRNCDLVEDYDEKEHCFIKPPRLNFKAQSNNSPLMAQQSASGQSQAVVATPPLLSVQQNEKNNLISDNLSIYSSGQLSPQVDSQFFTKSIRKGQTDQLVIEEIYQSNEELGLDTPSSSKKQKEQQHPIERNALKILQTGGAYDNKKAYIGNVRKSQGIIILQQEYLRQFYEKYNIPEQDLYSKDITLGIKKSKLASANSSSQLEGSLTNRSTVSQSKAPTHENGNQFLQRMNEQKKDQKQTLVSSIRSKQISQDIANQVIVVNSPLNNAQKQDLFQSQANVSSPNQLFFPSKTSGFKEFLGGLSNEQTLQHNFQHLKDPDASSMAKRRQSSQCHSGSKEENDFSRRASERLPISGLDKVETPKKNCSSNFKTGSFSSNNNKFINMNSSSQKFGLPNLSSSQEQQQLTDREKVQILKNSSELNTFNVSEMFHHKDSIKKLVDNNPHKLSISNNNQANSVSQRDLQHDLLQQNLLALQYKNTFYSQKTQFEQLTPKGKFFNSSCISLQGMVKTKNLQQNMRYCNPTLQVHQEYVEFQKTEKPTATLHSKGLHAQQNGFNSLNSHHIKDHMIISNNTKLQHLPSTKKQSIIYTQQKNDFNGNNPSTSRSEFGNHTLSKSEFFGNKEGMDHSNQLIKANHQQSSSQIFQSKQQQSDLFHPDQLYSQRSTNKNGQKNSSIGFQCNFNSTGYKEQQQQKIPSKRNININKLPLKYQLNLIIQTKDRKVTQGRLKQYMPQRQGLDILQSSGIHLQNRQKITHGYSQEYNS